MEPPGRHAALGVEYTPPQWPLYLKGNVGLSTFRGQEGAMVWDAVLRTAIYPYA